MQGPVLRKVRPGGCVTGQGWHTGKTVFLESASFRPKLSIFELEFFQKTLLGRAAQSEHELLLTYGALPGHGTDMNASQVALMMPTLTPEEISAAMKRLEAEDVIGKANKLIVESSIDCR